MVTIRIVGNSQTVLISKLHKLLEDTRLAFPLDPCYNEHIIQISLSQNLINMNVVGRPHRMYSDVKFGQIKLNEIVSW